MPACSEGLRFMKTTRFQHNDGLIPLFHAKHTSMADIVFFTPRALLLRAHACANDMNYRGTVRTPTCNKNYSFSSEHPPLP